MNNTVVDISPVLQILLALASAVVAGAIPPLVTYFVKYIGQQNNANLRNQLEYALQAAAGEAYNVALRQVGGFSNVQVENAAVQAAMKYVIEKMPDTLKALGWTETHVREAVMARLGQLLAVDPTVTAGPPAAVPLPAPPVPVAPLGVGAMQGQVAKPLVVTPSSERYHPK